MESVSLMSSFLLFTVFVLINCYVISKLSPIHPNKKKIKGGGNNGTTVDAAQGGDTTNFSCQGTAPAGEM